MGSSCTKRSLPENEQGPQCPFHELHRSRSLTHCSYPPLAKSNVVQVDTVATDCDADANDRNLFTLFDCDVDGSSAVDDAVSKPTLGAVEEHRAAACDKEHSTASDVLLLASHHDGIQKDSASCATLSGDKLCLFMNPLSFAGRLEAAATASKLSASVKGFYVPATAAIDMVGVGRHVGEAEEGAACGGPFEPQEVHVFRSTTSDTLHQEDLVLPLSSFFRAAPLVSLDSRRFGCGTRGEGSPYDGSSFSSRGQVHAEASTSCCEDPSGGCAVSDVSPPVNILHLPCFTSPKGKSKIGLGC